MIPMTPVTNPTTYPGYPGAQPHYPVTGPVPPDTASIPQSQPPRGGWRMFSLGLVTLALVVVAGTTLLPAVANARSIAYPRPAVALTVAAPAKAVFHVKDKIPFKAQTRAGRSLTYTWTFGDSSTPVAGATATHAYAVYGKYTVTLVATDPVGQRAQSTTMLNVLPIPPRAAFVASVDPNNPFVVHLDASHSSGTGLRYNWDFGDGNKASGGPQISHTYGSFNVWTVTLTVVDVAGQSSRATQQTPVSVPGPYAEFHESGYYYESPTTACLYFEASESYGAGPLTYFWDLGDGSYAYGEYVGDCYYTRGYDYYVTLTVTDIYGQSASFTSGFNSG